MATPHSCPLRRRGTAARSVDGPNLVEDGLDEGFAVRFKFHLAADLAFIEAEVRGDVAGQGEVVVPLREDVD